MRGYPSRYVVFDTETYQTRSSRRTWDNEQHLRLGVAKIYDPIATDQPCPVYHGFRTPEEFHLLLANMPLHKDKIFLFAHNIGFDCRVVKWFESVSAGDYSLFPPAGMPGAARYKEPLFVADSHPVIMRWFRRDGQQIMLIDSFNWFSMKLADVAGLVNLEKGKWPGNDVDEAKLWEYCQLDVDILDRALRRCIGLIQSINIPSWEVTPASQAALIWVNRFEKKRIIRPTDNDLVKLDRHAYYAGRVECFTVGRIDTVTHQLDVTGLYPFVMRDNPYPCEITETGDHSRETSIPSDFDPRTATAEVWIDSTTYPYPVRCSDGVIWCRGKVRTVLCGPELAQAVDRGDVLRIGRFTKFRMDDLFTGFVNVWWGIRQRAKQRGDKLTDYVAKRILNSLHGKFGQRDGEWQFFGRNSCAGLYANGKVIGPTVSEPVEYRIMDGNEFYRVRGQEHPRAFVPIAAWTASYGRVFMDEIRERIGNDNVHYQCVDSVIVDGNGLGNLQLAGIVDTGELGHFHYERSYQWIDIQGPNQLDFSGGYRHSGVKSGSAVTAEGIYECEEWETLGAAVYSGNVSSIGTRTILKRPSRIYTRADVGANRRSVPWPIDVWKMQPETIARKPMDQILPVRK